MRVFYKFEDIFWLKENTNHSTTETVKQPLKTARISVIIPKNYDYSSFDNFVEYVKTQATIILEEKHPGWIIVSSNGGLITHI